MKGLLAWHYYLRRPVTSDSMCRPKVCAPQSSSEQHVPGFSVSVGCTRLAHLRWHVTWEEGSTWIDCVHYLGAPDRPQTAWSLLLSRFSETQPSQAPPWASLKVDPLRMRNTGYVGHHTTASVDSSSEGSTLASTASCPGGSECPIAGSHPSASSWSASASWCPDLSPGSSFPCQVYLCGTRIAPGFGSSAAAPSVIAGSSPFPNGTSQRARPSC